MKNFNIKMVKKDNFGHVDLNKPIIFWSKICNGTINFLREQLEKLDFHVIELRSSQNNSNPLSLDTEEITLIRKKDKKIAFIFDEISNCNQNHKLAFETAVINNRIGDYQLVDGDVTIGCGRINHDSSLADSNISNEVIDLVSNYTLFLK